MLLVTPVDRPRRRPRPARRVRRARVARRLRRRPGADRRAAPTGRLVEPAGHRVPAALRAGLRGRGADGVELLLAALTALAFVPGRGARAPAGARAVGERAALAVGLSPPALAAADGDRAGGRGRGAAGRRRAAGAARSATRRGRRRRSGARRCWPSLPWLAVELAAPAAVIALALARWLRRRARRAGRLRRARGRRDRGRAASSRSTTGSTAG